MLDRWALIRVSQVIEPRRIRHPSNLIDEFDKARSIRESARSSGRDNSALQPISVVAIRGMRSQGN